MDKLEIKYIVHPGIVIASDGQQHKLTFSNLCRLYNVNPRECLNHKDDHSLLGYSYEYLHGLVDLYPQNSGDYRFKLESPNV